jgi:hypothetical protein
MAARGWPRDPRSEDMNRNAQDEHDLDTADHERLIFQ